MSDELDVVAVAARLQELRRLSVLETVEEGRRRLEPPPVVESFATAVSSRLAELRALCELTGHLHRRPPP